MNMRLNFDWKDGWLVSLGFGTAVGVSTLLHSQGIEPSRGLFQALVVACIFSAPAVRRAIFGSPQLGQRRKGLLWSLCSMFGLFVMFFGLAALFLTAVRIRAAQEEPPDFLEEELSYLNAPSLIDDVVPRLVALEESEQARRERLAKEQRDAEEEARARALERTEEWKQDAANEASKTWITSAVAAALLAIGSVCMSLRYKKPA